MFPTRPFWMGEFPNSRMEVIQGDSLAYYIQMFCDCPSPVNISGWQFDWEVKDSMDPQDPNVVAEVLWTCLNGQCGLTALIVIPAVTAEIPDGIYAWDLKYRTPSGLVKTLQRGQLDVLPSVCLDFSLGQEVPPANMRTPPPAALPPQGGYYYYPYAKGYE